MLICVCPVDEDCIAFGSGCDCFHLCEYLYNDGTEEQELNEREVKKL